MGRDRVCQVPKFTDICGNGDVESFSVVIQRRVCGSEGRRQTAIHSWVDEFSALRKEKFSDMMKCETSLLHGIGDGHRLEVAAVVDFASFSINQRIVSR